MSVFSNFVLDGVFTGLIYALLALGFSLIYRVSGILALAQGASVAISVLVMYTLIPHMGVAAAFVVAAVSLCAVLVLLAAFLVNPGLSRLSHTNLLMLMGGLLIFGQGLALVIWGATPVSLDPYTGGGPIELGSLVLPTQDFWVLAAAVVGVGATGILLARTATGKAMRATAQDAMAARLLGVRTNVIIALAFGLATLLGVIAGAAVGPLTSVDAVASMSNYTVYGLIAATLGGMGTTFGPVIGGLVLGVAEALIGGYVSTLYSTPLALFLFILLLVFRPQGLLGKSFGRRADVKAASAGKGFMLPRVPVQWGRAGFVAIIVVTGLVPLIMGNSGYMQAVVITAIFCLAAIGLDLLTGIGGLVSLGQAAFMAVGGYTAAILSQKWGFPLIGGLFVGLAFSIVLAGILALACSRISGMYLAIATLALGVLAESLSSGLGITGGANGISLSAQLSIFGFVFDSNTKFYYLTWVLVILALGGVLGFRKRIAGQLVRVMHEDEVGARSLGLSTPRAKMTLFVISAGMASVAGTLYACYFGYIAPTMIDSATSLSLVTMIVVGGYGTGIGAIIGAVLLTFLPFAFQSFAQYSLLANGLLLVVFLRYLQGGIYGSGLQALLRIPWARRKADRLHAAHRDGAGQKVTVRPHAHHQGLEPGVPVLELEGVTRSYGGVRAVNGVSLTVPAVSVVAIIGPNGAGKSTLFNLISRLDRPDSGQIRIFGRNSRSMHVDEISRAGLARSFQHSRYFPQLTVLENVMVGGQRLSSHGMVAQMLGTPRTRTEDIALERRARALLEFIGLGDRADHAADVLPLATQKRLDVVRCLMADPDLVMLDEPGAGLNDVETNELGALIKAIKDLGKTVVFVDHNMSLVTSVADHVVVLDAGAVIARGTPAEVTRDPLVIAAYMGIESGAEAAVQPTGSPR